MIRNSLLSYVIVISTCFVANIAASRAIVDGHKADVNEFPYQVALVVNENYNFCGGGIIRTQFILTAAHCFISDEGLLYDYSISVVAGTRDIVIHDATAVIAKITKVYISRDFEPRDKFTEGDIAVAKLDRSLGLSTQHLHLRRLKLPRNNSRMNYAGVTTTIAGFGHHWRLELNPENYIGGHHDNILRFARADVLDNWQCQHYQYTYGTYPPGIIKPKHLCAKVRQPRPSGTRGACYGDSGSPLVFNRTTVIGVFDITPMDNCSENNAAGIYTRVSDYLDFIDHAIKNDFNHYDFHVYVLRRD